MRRVLFTLLVLVLASLVLGACTAPPPASPRPPTPGSTHFTVMTYNIHRDKSGDTRTVEAIGASDADVVCLQEVTAAWAETLRRRYAQQYPHMLMAPKENAGGLAVLSRHPLEDHGVVPLPGDLHPGWVVHVTLPDVRVQLIHVHLRSLFNGTRDWVSNYFATGSDHVSATRLFLERASPDLPTIVAGDFNESPDGDAVRLLEDRGFSNVLPMFKPGQFTWYGKSIGLDMTIDHVMIDRSFVPLDGWVERRGSSDHLPVVAHIELRNQS
jgi:endonuclease/exonuclease/phosphatase family metal-dependent hydrolase